MAESGKGTVRLRINRRNVKKSEIASPVGFSHETHIDPRWEFAEKENTDVLK